MLLLSYILSSKKEANERKKAVHASQRSDYGADSRGPLVG